MSKPESHPETKAGTRNRVFVSLLCLVALLLVAVGVGWWNRSARYGAETPAAVYEHFLQLDRVEFLTVYPYPENLEFREGELIAPESMKEYYRRFGQVDGCVVLDRREIEHPSELIEHIIEADQSDDTTGALCFWPRHAIRDPSDHDSYLLMCFQCEGMKYRHDGLSDTVNIDPSGKKYFNALADSLEMTRDKSN